MSSVVLSAVLVLVNRQMQREKSHEDVFHSGDDRRVYPAYLTEHARI